MTHDIDILHMTLFWICVTTGFFVFAVMIYSIIAHRKSRGLMTHPFHKKTWVELTWTFISLIVLILLIIPSIRVLMSMNGLSKEDVPPATKTFTMTELMQKGHDIYQGLCAACHQPTGLGLPPAYPALNGSPLVTGPTDTLLNRVLNGKPGTAMPAFRDQLNDEEIAAVATFERNSWHNKTGTAIQPSEVTAARAKPVTTEEKP
ncbi:MAG: cytochrome c [Gammaproteobacteria bacterium]|nr:cytochrome c [Gammaproteobacteria bacterium]